LSERVPTERLPKPMLAFLDAHVAREEPLALVTVLETEGSSYSKAGHPLLVGAEGELSGLLSGGCLETDLIERCRTAIAQDLPLLVTYDLGDDDSPFGLGVGCDGAMHVLVYPMSVDNQYEPVAQARQLFERQSRADIEICSDKRTWRLRWLRPGRILVLGAGPDVEPLLSIGESLGWDVTVNDHRPGWIDRLDKPTTIRVSQVAPRELAEQLDLDSYDAAIVMSHNLDADRGYLSQLASSRIAFMGLLGPRRRRELLLSEIGGSADFESRLRSPVGMKIGGRGPGAIALEIAAELQAYFCDLDRRLAAVARSAGVSISIEAGSNATSTTAPS
jgi:xanthine dehydrogenase accessory factor